MHDNIIETLRRRSITSCFGLPTFKKVWPTWKPGINKILGKHFDANELLDLGDHLSKIFASTGQKGRPQSSLSGGGKIWEGLIVWYLNLCFAGSNGVAVRKISDLPIPFRHGISVNYNNFTSNTESDITVLIFPPLPAFVDSKYSLSVANNKGEIIPTTKNGIFNYAEITDALARAHFDKFELGIIQCKTNWNDNAQIPMLWNMIYDAEDFSDTSITIGRASYSIHDLKKFSYSFCTVPTIKLEKIKPTSTCVNRVRTLSGGNYWGHPSSNGIANSIKEIFNVNFKNAFAPSNQRLILNKSLNLLSTDLSYFQID